MTETIKKEIIELPPSCCWCENFIYTKGAEELYSCEVQGTCYKTNDIFELFEDCPYLDYKYVVREYKVDGADD